MTSEHLTCASSSQRLQVICTFHCGQARFVVVKFFHYQNFKLLNGQLYQLLLISQVTMARSRILMLIISAGAVHIGLRYILCLLVRFACFCCQTTLHTCALAHRGRTRISTLETSVLGKATPPYKHFLKNFGHGQMSITQKGFISVCSSYKVYIYYRK